VATQVSPAAAPSRRSRSRSADPRPGSLSSRSVLTASTPSTRSRILGPSPGPPPDRRPAISCASRSTSRTVRSASSPPTTVPPCGSRAASAPSAPAPASRTWTCRSPGPSRLTASPSTVRSRVDRPLRGPPTASQVPPASRSSRSGSCVCRSGRSTRPMVTTARPPSDPGACPSSGPGSSRSGSGGRQGRCGIEMPAVRDRRVSVRQSRARSLSPPATGSGTGEAVTGHDHGRTVGPVVALDGAVALTRATWNAVGAPLPDRSQARPGTSSGRCAAWAVPRTSRDSASSVVRRQTRRLQLARISGDTTPLGRWVASTRCTPSDRPRWAIATSPGTNSGSSSDRPANSSTTITRRARSTGAGRDAMSATPWVARIPSRRVSSAASERRARAVVCPSRSVTRPTVWGRAAASAKAAPPL
jgi:hypothetical protein